MAERVTIVLAERPFGGGSDMGKDQSRRSFGGNSLQVHAVPGRCGRGEEARGGAQSCVGVETKAEAICIVLSAAGILQSETIHLAMTHRHMRNRADSPVGGASRMTA